MPSKGASEMALPKLNNFGLGLPAPVARRTPHRRTSDFFAETLSALDDLTHEGTIRANEYNEREKAFAYEGKEW